MKTIFEGVINRGGYDLSDLLKKIDSYHISGQLSDSDKDELYAAARGEADPSGNLDMLKKILELEDRVAALEQGKVEQPSESVEGFVPGKWYRTGDRISFNGIVYVCIAPEGQVCTWNPAEYPAYWEADAK